LGRLIKLATTCNNSQPVDAIIVVSNLKILGKSDESSTLPGLTIRSGMLVHARIMTSNYAYIKRMIVKIEQDTIWQGYMVVLLSG